MPADQLQSTMASAQSFNFNVGILGHVDSGKTSLAKALSTIGSTAAFDKHPQSKERGITLDLGFSTFTLPLTQSKKDADEKFRSVLRLGKTIKNIRRYLVLVSYLSPISVDHYFRDLDSVQVTLVDCPGHASLIRTVIGGSQIIDLVFLVIDAQKGL